MPLDKQTHLRTSHFYVKDLPLFAAIQRRTNSDLHNFHSMISRGQDYVKVKVPLQAWSGPEGSRKLRFPDFMTTAQDGGKIVSLMHRPPLPPGNASGTHFCYRLSRPQGHSAIGRILCRWKIRMTPVGIESARSGLCSGKENTVLDILRIQIFMKVNALCIFKTWIKWVTPDGYRIFGTQVFSDIRILALDRPWVMKSKQANRTIFILCLPQKRLLSRSFSTSR